MQYGLDYFGDENLQTELIRFSHANADIIDKLQELANQYVTASNANTSRIQTYDKLHTWATPNPDEVTKIALGAAGAAVYQSKHALREQFEAFGFEATELSINMVAYLTHRVPGATSFRLHGTVYGLDFPVITRRFGHRHTMVFANGEVFRDLSMKIFNGNKSSVKKENMHTSKHPGVQDWLTLFDNLIACRNL